MTKIVALEKLPDMLLSPEHRGLQVVQCHGCYDVTHVGHLRHFKEAASYGNTLVVTVTSDRYVNKGANRPIFNQEERAEMVAGFGCVDLVAISDYPDAVHGINIIKPDYYAKGCDYLQKGVIAAEKKAVEDNGGILVFTTTEKYSTTEIINKVKKG